MPKVVFLIWYIEEFRHIYFGVGIYTYVYIHIHTYSMYIYIYIYMIEYMIDLHCSIDCHDGIQGYVLLVWYLPYTMELAYLCLSTWLVRGPQLVPVSAMKNTPVDWLP